MSIYIEKSVFFSSKISSNVIGKRSSIFSVKIYFTPVFQSFFSAGLLKNGSSLHLLLLISAFCHVALVKNGQSSSEWEWTPIQKVKLSSRCILSFRSKGKRKKQLSTKMTSYWKGECMKTRMESRTKMLHLIFEVKIQHTIFGFLRLMYSYKYSRKFKA